MFNSNCSCRWGGCIPSKLCKGLLIVGGLNWGLIGLGMLMSKDWNAIYMILGSMPTLEAIVYLLVGVAAVMKLIGCKCKKCVAACANCSCGADSKMGGSM